MCDECAYCYRASWQAGELRQDEQGLLWCSDCFGGHDDEWLAMPTIDELNEMIIAAKDDRTHAIRDMRAGL